MTEDPRGDGVSRQYDRWEYPPPVTDLAAWTTNHWDRFEPYWAHRVLWPNREYKPDLDILVAGCGTFQAAVLAYMNRGAKVVAIDVSQSALNHHRDLKDRHGLDNLELHLLPIEEVSALSSDFDLIVSSGVLHHMADPLAGLTALGSVCGTTGCWASCSTRSTAGSASTCSNRRFATSGCRRTRRRFNWSSRRSALPQDHPVRSYLQAATDLMSEGALVDTFLHARQRSYTVGECLDLVDAAGLAFQGWLRNTPYYPHDFVAPASQFQSVVNQLPDEKLWSVMERLQPANATHFFLACRPERPKQDYAIDFSAASCFDYVPLLRAACVLSGETIHLPGATLKLNPAQLPFVAHIDGRRTINEIVDCVAQRGDVRPEDRELVRDFGRSLFRSLWRLDFVAMALNGRVRMSVKSVAGVRV